MSRAVQGMSEPWLRIELRLIVGGLFQGCFATYPGVIYHSGFSANAAINALPEVVKIAKGRLPVLFDSGIRSGSDMFKALALGASAICLGRPYVYGLAIAGEHGVREVIQNILAEFDLTMALAGCATLEDVAHATLERVV